MVTTVNDTVLPNEGKFKKRSTVITHLEPDILESEVKWALESITRNKASGGDGILVGKSLGFVKSNLVSSPINSGS